jgi:hypothetical protein
MIEKLAYACLIAALLFGAFFVYACVQLGRTVTPYLFAQIRWDDIWRRRVTISFLIAAAFATAAWILW